MTWPRRFLAVFRTRRDTAMFVVAQDSTTFDVWRWRAGAPLAEIVKTSHAVAGESDAGRAARKRELLDWARRAAKDVLQ